MPVDPEYIPIPKGKELYALASWRQTPVLGSQLLSDKDKNNNNNNNNNNNKNAKGKSEELPEEGGSRRRGGRRGKNARAKKAAAGALNTDVEDYFIQLSIPPTVAVQTVRHELEVQPTPLREFNVGVDQQLFPRPSATPPTRSHHTSNNNTNDNTMNKNKNEEIGAIGTPPGWSQPSQRPIISPFQTPALFSLTDDPEGLPEMELPPSLSGDAATTTGGKESNHSSNNNNNNNNSQQSQSNQKSTPLSPNYHLYLLYAERSEAEQVQEFVKRRWPQMGVTMTSRSRPQRNTSLVLKGLPNLQKTEIIIEALYGSDIAYKPSYVRLHRGERGTYKNVIFIKYKNREEAEDSKLRLEHLYVGPRPLRVEFKKKLATLTVEEEDAMQEGSLQQRVRELRISNEHEGFIYRKDQLSKEELKLLKQLCQSYDLLFEVSDLKVSVRRQLGPSKPSKSPSPGLRPQSSPSWAAVTPAPLRPMDFKGIRHWKEMRELTSDKHKVGIIRTKGPEDGLPSFPAGRGKPLA